MLAERAECAPGNVEHLCVRASAAPGASPTVHLLHVLFPEQVTHTANLCSLHWKSVAIKRNAASLTTDTVISAPDTRFRYIIKNQIVILSVATRIRIHVYLTHICRKCAAASVHFGSARRFFQYQDGVATLGNVTCFSSGISRTHRMMFTFLNHMTYT